MKQLHPSVRNWLWFGIFMIMVQVILGGVTRLTGSGLSITEWNVVMGAIPPLNHAQWMLAFEKYKHIPQYAVLNSHFTLSDFKFIFMWEFTHRLWARSIVLVFLIPFVIFLVKRRIPRFLIIQLLIAFTLGALQGLVGWIMVKSGLSDRIWVSPLKLTLHLLTALILFAYMIKMAWEGTVQERQRPTDKRIKRFSLVLLIGLVIQIGFGGLMAGAHAATFFPTWPDMNGQVVPDNVFAQSPWWMNFMNNMGTIQVFHRFIAYTLFFAIIGFAYLLWKRNRSHAGARTFALVFIGLVVLQVTLGILTLLGSAGGHIPILWGVLHQSVGLLLFTTMQACYMYFRAQPAVEAAPREVPQAELASL